MPSVLIKTKFAAVVLDCSRMGVAFGFFPTARIRKIPRKIKRLSSELKRSFSNDDADGSENGKNHYF